MSSTLPRQIRRAYSLQFHKHEVISTGMDLFLFHTSKEKKDIRPLPWGDGQTPFFTAMKQYWGFADHEKD
ncbi:unnamed protein product [Mesocestoides corti]|uniref:Cytochrome P450 n=1 Tax=Mesocestoides corti TaxID=53468 RepID=A0A0R3UFQ6_MESCO|nr:unnamed protein product [Mesocestoides corti]